MEEKKREKKGKKREKERVDKKNKEEEIKIEKCHYNIFTIFS